jgi:hypothetical protein
MTKNDMNDVVRFWFRVAEGPSPILIPKQGRQGLAQFYKKMGFTRGAEIGVRRGLHAQQICEAVPGIELLCVDPWAPQEDYIEAKVNETMEDAYEDAQERLAPYRCQFIRATSVVGASLVPDRSLDFAYIDGNHLEEFVLQDLSAWTPKVKPGGIIGGHDYLNVSPHIGVKNAVDRYTVEHGIDPWFVLSGIKSDKGPSYFWVVE